MAKKHNYYMDFLRILAAFGVVMIHSLVPVDYSAPFSENVIFYGAHCVLNSAVPLFIMMSGVLFLANDKDYSFREMIFKYSKKIFIYIIVFCTFLPF